MYILVERRKIQKTGSSSYIITLPKEWIDAVGAKPGDYVLVYEHGNKLIITPSYMETQQLSSEITITGAPDIQEVFRIVVAQYLAGYSTITVVFKDNIPGLAKRISELKNLARVKLAGVEVVDETYNTIVFKILLNIKELPLMRAIRRLHLIVNNMLSDAITAFRTKNLSLAEAVIQRDDEADRFHFMITRQLALALLDIRIMHELGITSPVETINYRILARNLERIADHAVNIAYRVRDRPDDCKYCIDFCNIGDSVIELFNKSMDSIYRLSRRTAEETINKAKMLVEELQQLLSHKVLVDNSIASEEKTVLSMVYDSLRRITRYSNGIAEATLNIKVAKTNRVEIK